MLNVEHAKELRAFIASLPEAACNMNALLRRATHEHNRYRYVTPQEMKDNGFHCGTVGCLKGWGGVYLALQGTNKRDISNIREFVDSVEKWLWDNVNYNWDENDGGENWDESENLFYSFSDNPQIGWKAWMILRLDDIINRGGEVIDVKSFESIHKITALP